MKMGLKTVLITGAKEGMGFHIASSLAFKNYKVILADKQDLTSTKEEIIQKTCNENVITKYLDLASLTSVRSFAKDLIEKESNLHVLINNAGVFCKENEKTEDCLHPTMQINHFSPFLLTCLLADIMKKSAPSRIIFVTSSGAFFSNLTLNNLNDPKVLPIELISSTLTYYNSKLCNMIVSRGFAEKLQQYKVTSNCFHPGMMNTDFLLKHRGGVNFQEFIQPLAKKIISFITQSVEESSKLAIYLATSNSMENITGKYFENFQIHEQPRKLDDCKFCNNIWIASEHYTNMVKEERLA